uniref:Peptidase M12B domain-containing protein n=1 Tax=Panagrolaimus sp. PS1159 TaxID=55785 RepID=A0AC35FLB9_9BILA
MAGDHSIFEAFLQIQQSTLENAHFAVQVYLEAIFDQMKAIYSQQLFFGKHQLELRLAGTLVIEKEDDCPLKHTIFNDYDNTTDTSSLTLSLDSLRAIGALSSWRALHLDVLPRHDHIIFLTKFDLLSPNGASSTQGMGFVGKMCDKSESISVVEDIGALTTAAIASHELGHSLGAYHDGEIDKTCSSRGNFLMAPSASTATSGKLFENGFKLSECSLKFIEKFMETIESACLTAKPLSPGKRDMRRSPFTQGNNRKLWPGEQFGATRQCQIAFAPHYGDCQLKQYKNLSPDPCRRLWCKNRMENRFAPCETKSYLPLMDGTECGLGKWCLRGNCIKNEFYDPDQECQNLNENYCRERYTPAQMKIYCVRKSFAEICCKQCKKYNHYLIEKYRNAEKRFRKQKIPPRNIFQKPIANLGIKDISLNSTDIDY